MKVIDWIKSKFKRKNEQWNFPPYKEHYVEISMNAASSSSIPDVICFDEAFLNRYSNVSSSMRSIILEKREAPVLKDYEEKQPKQKRAFYLEEI
jgi:hypothetical protein